MYHRKYTVEEIDQLRDVIRNRMLWGSYHIPQMPGGSISITYREDELTTRIEEHVRTHMMAGHTAADLLGEE